MEPEDGLQIIENMSRSQLLAAHDLDGVKDGTERLRAKARRRWLVGDPHFCLWVD